LSEDACLATIVDANSTSTTITHRLLQDPTSDNLEATSIVSKIFKVIHTPSEQQSKSFTNARPKSLSRASSNGWESTTI